MITLCMDTSHVYLTLALIQDEEIVASVQEECWKRQSEEIFPKLEKMLTDVDMCSDDIDQVVITKGPGSYTGVRIAMTVAKVFCALKGKPLYTISTLQLYAGIENCRVVIDARGGRVYTCLYRNGKPVESERIEYIADITHQLSDEKIVGDAQLFGENRNYLDMSKNFLLLKDEWKLANNVHTVVPEYLKSSDAYRVGSK